MSTIYRKNEKHITVYDTMILNAIQMITIRDPEYSRQFSYYNFSNNAWLNLPFHSFDTETLNHIVIMPFGIVPVLMHTVRLLYLQWLNVTPCPHQWICIICWWSYLQTCLRSIHSYLRRQWRWKQVTFLYCKLDKLSYFLDINYY